MNRPELLFPLLLILGLSTQISRALVTRATGETDHQFEHADAVLVGLVTGKVSFQDEQGHIHTRYTIQVLEPLKGRLPDVLSITVPGGVTANRGESVGCQPVLKTGEERLFFLSQDGRGALVPSAGCVSTFPANRPDFIGRLDEVRWLSVASLSQGTDLTAQQSYAPLTTQSDPVAPLAFSGATNLLTDDGGIAARFLRPDRGEPIPCLVDMDALPAGITTNAALTAVSNALAAWAAVSSAEFSFLGVQSFGTAANDVSASDGVLRIQLHDLHGAILGSTTLGVGGRSYRTNVLSSDWTTGGQVFGNDFHQTTSGYVILNHTNSSMQDTNTFEEVLCHEIGHALGMGHSTPDTPAPVGSAAWEAQMYYLAHQDGRGAAPTSWDTNVLQQVHPVGNTPPYLFDRVMDITTHWADPPAVPGINEIRLSTYDLQSTNLFLSVANGTSGSGTFSLTGDQLRFTPRAFYGAPRLDPASGSNYAKIYSRCYDGTHASPYVSIRVVSFNPDYKPDISDGIPDQWMIANFGNADPAVGGDHGANDDKDGDTIINIDEYRSWMNPTNPLSAQLITAAANGTVSWQGKAYELYELYCSTDLVNWYFVQAVLPTNDTPSVQADPRSPGSAIYRAFKVP